MLFPLSTWTENQLDHSQFMSSVLKVQVTISSTTNIYLALRRARKLGRKGRGIILAQGTRKISLLLLACSEDLSLPAADSFELEFLQHVLISTPFT